VIDRAAESGVKSSFLYTSKGVAKLSMILVGMLIVMKAVAGIVTGSIGIGADAVHSSIDLFAAFIGFLAIRIAGKPPDEDHRYGHGRAEDIAGVVIAALIFAAAGSISYEAVMRLLEGGAVEMVTIGIYVTAGAIAINLAISWWALRVARATDSVALEATARHLYADVLSSVAVLAGLVLVRLTGIIILDPIVALLVAVLIGRTAYLTIRKSLGDLMDKQLPATEEEIILECIKENGHKIVEFHELRTRKAGGHRFVDVHLVMPREASVEEAHQICDYLEHRIRQRLQRINVNIHVEPCKIQCSDCGIDCLTRA